jgi:hypothetical protein
MRLNIIMCIQFLTMSSSIFDYFCILAITTSYEHGNKRLVFHLCYRMRCHKPCCHIVCNQTLLVYLFKRFACINYRRFIATRHKFKHSMYIQEPLVIGRRGFVQREIQTRKCLAADKRGGQSSKRPVW